MITDRELNMNGLNYLLKDPCIGNTYESTRDGVIRFGLDKKIIDSKNIKSQFLKVIEEIGELSKAILEEDKSEIEDAIGDVLITIELLVANLNMAKLIDKDLISCYALAYDVIKNRTGKTINGTFIRDKEKI